MKYHKLKSTNLILKFNIYLDTFKYIRFKMKYHFNKCNKCWLSKPIKSTLMFDIHASTIFMSTHFNFNFETFPIKELFTAIQN